MVDLERVAKIEAQLEKLEAAYKSATTKNVRESCGSAIDAWSAMLREVKYPR